jgi:hypothetical protein
MEDPGEELEKISEILIATPSRGSVSLSRIGAASIALIISILTAAVAVQLELSPSWTLVWIATAIALLGLWMV